MNATKPLLFLALLISFLTLAQDSFSSATSQKVLDKIFQPFFATKPTGQVTGSGLSLSYDIVTTYGGELKVETKEGQGSVFVIALLTTFYN